MKTLTPFGLVGSRLTTGNPAFYRVREGLITEYRSGYRSRQEALEAAGLRQ
jgi:hypothetical protein